MEQLEVECPFCDVIIIQCNESKEKILMYDLDFISMIMCPNCKIKLKIDIWSIHNYIEYSINKIE